MMSRTMPRGTPEEKEAYLDEGTNVQGDPF